ncbi:MAG: DUF6044 family protein [Bacteroidetes bacterium]|nr:DUF6044 family protein [Bacteroidota bacterium]
MNKLNKNNFPQSQSKEKTYFKLSFLIIALYFLPYIILGKNSPLLILDNMDSNITWVKIILESGNLFSNPYTKIDQVLNGISNSSIYGIYDFSLIWFKTCGIYWGYVINKFLMTIVGFIGMYYLLKKHFLPKDVYILIPFGVSLIFAFLPFWSFTMSVCGLPLLLFAFLNLRNKTYHYSNWLIILLFPFYSSLILSGVFFMLIITLIFIYDAVRFRLFNYQVLLGIILMGCMYIISHFPLFYTFIFRSSIVSHRIEFQMLALSFLDASQKAFKLFSEGQFHAQSLHTFIIIPVLFGSYLLYKAKSISRSYKFILIFILLTSMFYGFLDWSMIAQLNKKLMDTLPIQLQRLHFLHPIFWYILFAVSLYKISTYFNAGKKIVMILLLIQFLYVVGNHELIANRKGPSFNQFYAQKQFNEIKTFINKPQNSYRVISVGIHPSIAQFNGFYTLDGYFPSYPLEYKHEFREIISPELDKSKKLKDYFDNWGSRCYAFSSETGLDFVDPKYRRIQQLDYNFDAFKKMGGEYIISRAEIDLGNNTKLKLVKTFSKYDSYWKIYLYEVL